MTLLKNPPTSTSADATPGSAAARAYAHVKQRLLDGRFAGGALLSENELAQQLGLSRTPVRQAFIALEAEDSLSTTADVDGSFGSPADIGMLFLSDHLLAFEVTSIVLLVAAVGGVILGSSMPKEQEE